MHACARRHACGRRRPAVELHGSVGQRDTLLHDGRPLVRRRREGAAAHGHQCNENFLHRNLGVLQADLLCSVGEHDSHQHEFFFRVRRSCRRVITVPYPVQSTKTSTGTEQNRGRVFTAQKISAGGSHLSIPRTSVFARRSQVAAASIALPLGTRALRLWLNHSFAERALLLKLPSLRRG